jgi:uracil DNA glycosylase
MGEVNPKIHESWLEVLQEEFEAPYFAALKDFLVEEKKQYRCNLLDR